MALFYFAPGGILWDEALTGQRITATHPSIEEPAAIKITQK